MATQIRAVQAFKRSLKRSSKEKAKKEDGGGTAKSGEILSSKELAVLCKSPLSCTQTDSPSGGERRRRGEEDDINYEDEYSGVVKRRTGDKSSSEEAEDKLLASAFKKSFGKLKKNSKTSNSSPNKAGLS